MRPSLLHPLREPRHSRRRRRRRAAQTGEPRTAEPAREEPAREEPAREPVLRTYDLAVERVREAGGPIDHASYICQCGYLFSADVSTTVACPHCGADQAW
jgi:rubrerythrin